MMMDERALLDLFGLMDKSRGAVRECKYYPCHFEGQDCSLCFCPFYPCFLYDLGGEIVLSSSGKYVWSCKNCEWVHRKEVVEEIAGYFSTVPRQIVVEAEWTFLNRALQNILFGEVLSEEVVADGVTLYSMMKPNFHGKECRAVESSTFLIVSMNGYTIESVRRVDGLESLHGLIKGSKANVHVLIPEKDEEKLTGFVDGVFVECLR